MKQLAIASLIAAAIGCSALPAQAQAPAAWRNSPQTQKLYDQAKKEGQVVVWGEAARDLDWLPKAFGAAFPGIEVKVMADDNAVSKAITEARSGRHSVDLMSESLTMALKLDERKMLKPVDWSQFGVKPQDTAMDGKMGFTYNVVYTVVYNKDKVQPQDVPKSWSDLLDPKYKGKMVANQFLLPRLVGVLALAWSEDKTTQFARDLRANADIMQTSAPREPFLQSGERLYSVAEVDAFPKMWARDGIPVSFVIPEPVVTAQVGVVMIDEAPHPAAAQLMAGWMASAEGRREREKATFQMSYLPSSDKPEVRKIYDSGAKVILDTPDLVARRAQMMSTIGPIVAGQAR